MSSPHSISLVVCGGGVCMHNTNLGKAITQHADDALKLAGLGVCAEEAKRALPVLQGGLGHEGLGLAVQNVVEDVGEGALLVLKVTANRNNGESGELGSIVGDTMTTGWCVVVSGGGLIRAVVFI